MPYLLDFLCLQHGYDGDGGGNDADNAADNLQNAEAIPEPVRDAVKIYKCDCGNQERCEDGNNPEAFADVDECRACEFLIFPVFPEESADAEHIECADGGEKIDNQEQQLDSIEPNGNEIG